MPGGEGAALWAMPSVQGVAEGDMEGQSWGAPLVPRVREQR